MFRSISKGVSLQLSTAWPKATCRRNVPIHRPHRHQRMYTTSHSFLRYHSSIGRIPSLEPSRPSKSTPPISLPPTLKKPKVELRPGPLKPKSSLHSAVPGLNTSLRPQQLTRVSPTMTLGTAKEAAQKDIQDAELHGILPPPPPGANWFRRTLHKGVELAKFYFRGVKLIFIRRQEISAIRSRIKVGGPPLTRREFRLIRTQKDDINKVIPFLVIALLLEEVIPLIAIFAPFMLPSTCILPSQRARIEAKRVEKAHSVASNSRTIFSALLANTDPSGQVSFEVLRDVEGAPTAICGILGLPTVGIDALRIRRLRQHLEFLANDDQLLMQDHIALTEAETSDALAERGIMVRSLNHKAKTAQLQWWLESAKDAKLEDSYARRLFLILSRQ